MTQPHDPTLYILDEDEFDELEEILVSDVVPDDCMNLEMLDGYLAAVVAAPVVLEREDWLPDVWSAHGDDADFGGGQRVQRAVQLVLRYYNELVVTLDGAPDDADPEDDNVWQPFCYQPQEGDPLGAVEEWVEGFAQGMELWPDDWQDRDVADADRVQDMLDELLAPWSTPKGLPDNETRLEWLESAGETLREIAAVWRAAGLPRPQVLEIGVPAEAAPKGPGRNDPCPCGSGKKFKKCCGAGDD